MRTALIVGVAGTKLSRDEAQFLKDARPAGFILFARNLKDHAQIRALISDVRSAVGADDLLVLIDQEGGRVQRLRPPLGRALPPAAAYGALYARDHAAAVMAAFEATRLLAADLSELGINTDCAPVLDLPVPGAHDIIGDRALGSEPMQVAALGRAVLDGMASAGVVGIIKHMPGHGRALLDSHKALPVVPATSEELETDLEPFERLRSAPMGMTAHVVYEAWDPDRPASLSPIVIRDIIRGRIGFDGFLMSDDLGMEALQGDFGGRAAGVVAAGCDVALHCSGKMDEMVAVAEAAPLLAPAGEERLARAMAITLVDGDGLDFAEAIAKRDALLALA